MTRRTLIQRACGLLAAAVAVLAGRKAEAKPYDPTLRDHVDDALKGHGLDGVFRARREGEAGPGPHDVVLDLERPCDGERYVTVLCAKPGTSLQSSDDGQNWVTRAVSLTEWSGRIHVTHRYVRLADVG